MISRYLSVRAALCVIPAMIPVILFLATDSLGQAFTISGIVRDADSGEVLIGANIHALSFGTGTVSNRYGFYSLTLPQADSTTIAYTFIGFEPQVKKVYLDENLRLDIELISTATLLDGIVVTAESAAENMAERNVRSTRMSVVDVPIRFVEALPAILGEQDVLKVIQLLPGVQSAQEGTTGFHVRGGNLDQNLVELDEATVYNPNHLFGLFSTFNSRALNHIELVKGGFPAQYGGRLSSVVRISMREGNRKEFVGRAGVGLISAQLSLEGPLIKNRTSYIISGRRSYIDIVAKPFQTGHNDNTYFFYDLNAKVNHQLSANDRLYGSFFTGRDIVEYVDSGGLGYGIRFGNSTGTFRWNHLFGPKLFSNVSLIFNQYFIRVNTIQGQFYSQNYSGIRDATAKTTLEYYPSPRHTIQLGGVATKHVFKSTGTGGQLPTGQVVTTIDPERIPERKTSEYAFFIQDDWNVNDRTGISAGLRVPFYVASDANYSALEPRISVRVAVDSASSIKASYTRMNQFIHLVPSSTASLPTDIWTPSSKITKPQVATQYALGYFRNFKEGKYETSLELYYKEMERQVLFREGTQLLAYEDIDDVLTFGRGWSYGAELFIRRQLGRLTGWLSYTLSWTRQKFDALNRGASFPFKYDRRHNLAVVGTYRLNRRWSLSSNFIFQTGPAYTLPVGRLFSNLGGDLYQGLFYDYDRFNNYRLGSYHRLDVAATFKTHPRWVKEGELVISVYNIYSRLNPYYVFLDLDTTSGEPVGKQVSLLPIVPSVSYNVRF